MQSGAGGHVQFNVQGERLGFFRAVRQGARQPILAETTGRQAIVTGRLREQIFIDTALLPVARNEVLTEHAQINHCRLEPRQTGQQRLVDGLIDRREISPCRLQNCRFHQGHRHRSRDVEDVPFASKVGLNVSVVWLDAGLLLAAENQHRRTRHDQRPERLQLFTLQRIERVVGANGRQDVQGIALGMVQQRRAGHRQVGHSPGADQIAEVDQPLHLPLALRITPPDHVVLGDIQVHRLYRQ